MMSVINNMSAFNAQRQYNLITSGYTKSAERISSGYKINRAADDAANLTISEEMRAKIRGLNQGSYNIQDGISVMQIADGALEEVSGMIHRLNELAIKSANGTNTDADRAAIQSEADAIVKEIDRIAESTEFNTMKIFDRATIEGVVGPITKLVESPSADKGFLGEAFKVGSRYYPAASMDFSRVNEKNIGSLDGCYFGFTCSQNCSETFKITFATGQDGTKSTGPTNPNTGRAHDYVIDISNCTSGSDITATVMSYITAHPARSSTPSIGTGVSVSHSNALVNDGAKLYVVGNPSATFSTEEDAKNYFPNSYKGMGAVDCSTLSQVYTPDPVLDFRIQCSNSVSDYEMIHTRMMNAEYIGLKSFDVSTQETAENSIAKAAHALSRVSSDRSDYGAYQNRLEHSYANNENKAENTTAAESRIRDADMAKEVLNRAKSELLMQVGTSIMGQANQSAQNVLSLLQ